MKIRLLTATLLIVICAPLFGGDELPKCSETRAECEHKIREMMTGKKYLGIIFYDSETGILIKSVVDDSPAEEAGLRSGDVIVAVNGQDTSSGNVKLFKKLVEQSKEKGLVRMKVKRNGKGTIEVEAKLTEISEQQIQRVIKAHMKAAHEGEKR